MMQRTYLPTIGDRYTLLKLLGAGGMGEVYFARDRLTGSEVALKRVTSAGEHRQAASISNTTNFNFALAQEFQTLASLRHPNIISVLDYGFDELQEPFFTMSLLQDPGTIVAMGKSKPLDFQVRLLVQMFQALAYLHRRGIIHRDVKPDNVLVDGAEVKMLDFGLAVLASQSAEHDRNALSGTLGYMAPELFTGESASMKADLYACGLIAYEMLAGHFPFDRSEISQLINSIISDPIDVRAIGVSDALADVLDHLLAKDPHARYYDADEAIDALCAAVGMNVPRETVEIRESFLQAALFVGRDRELTRLTSLLDDASGGQGSMWLIGGESGVGKSRLLNELRIRALVKGLRVIRGQAVSEGNSPYQVWRDPVRHLALTTNLSPLEEGVLKEIAPDLDQLLDAEITPAPELDGPAGQQRLISTLIDVFRRQRQPILLLLEDLQWSAESLEPVQQISAAARDLPLLIVGTYRSDEHPDLPEALPDTEVIPLRRLDKEAIAQLSESMLGLGGREASIVNFLQEQTEGNVFFLVEVVRALAEEAGQLGQISGMDLPEEIVAGGIQEVIRRRLSRAPDDARPLLKLAAVSGRELDMAVLQTLVDTQQVTLRTDLEGWLATCATYALLQPQGESWDFAHDKLRQGILADLPADERSALHHQVAEAVEAVHPNDDTYAPALFEHWAVAGDPQKIAHYALIAGRQTLAISAFRETTAITRRALDALDPSDEGTAPARMALLQLQGDALAGLSEFPAAADAYRASEKIAYNLDDTRSCATAFNGLGTVAANQGDYPAARSHYDRALELAQKAGDRLIIARALNGLGSVALDQGDLATAEDYYRRSLTPRREMDDKQGIAASLSNLCNLAYYQGDYETAKTQQEESLAIRREIGDRQGIAISLMTLGVVALAQGDYNAARDYFEESLTSFQEIGDRKGIAFIFNNLGYTAEQQGDNYAASMYYENSADMSRETGDRWGIANSLCNLAFVQLRLMDTEEAERSLREALHTAHDIGATGILLEGLAGYARLYIATGQVDRAAEVVGLVSAHPANNEELEKGRLAPLRDDLQYELETDELAEAIRRGEQADFDSTVAAILAD